jgi:hypothetical protein
VSKHTTCGDVDEGGVKRLVEVPGCRCRHRDVDVDAVLFGTNKARKNQNSNTLVNARKFGAKGLTKVVKICVKITPDFVAKGSNRCQKGYYDVKTECQHGAYVCIPALPGVEASYFRSG